MGVIIHKNARGLLSLLEENVRPKHETPGDIQLEDDADEDLDLEPFFIPSQEDFLA
jgi:hypothetical protein